MSDDNLFLDRFEPVVIRERRGPHWRQDGKLYFVTWRQADSLPREVREEIEREREAWMARHGNVPFNDLSERDRKAYEKLFDQRIQRYLDTGYGSCVLVHEGARDIMAHALHHFNGARYDLGSFAIAANHVHVLVAPRPAVDLSEIQHSWKSFTANKINALMGTTGRLWRPESYDRIVRNARELSRIVNYILKHRESGHYVEHLPI